MTTRSPELTEFGRVLRKFFSATASMESARQALDVADDWNDLWRRELTELDLAGLAVPERFGGQGYGISELAVVNEEAGRALAGGPLFPTACLAAPLLEAAATAENKHRLLEAVATGVAFAVCCREPFREADVANISVQAVAQPGGDLRLTGRHVDVAGARQAGILLAMARLPNGDAGLFEVNPRDPGVTITTGQAIDSTRPLDDVTYNEVAVRLLSGPTDASTGLARGLEIARTCLAAESMGAATAAVERTLEFLHTREQFGGAIGGFQALQHRIVDVAVAIELARSGVQHAVDSLEHQRADASLAVSLASAAAQEAFRSAVTEEIQLHGGIGVAWESDAHLAFRRSTVSWSLLGTPHWHRKNIATLITNADERSKR